MAILMCSPEEKYEAQLIKELGDELVPMSTPGMAVFTLRFEEHILDQCVKNICIAVLESFLLLDCLEQLYAGGTNLKRHIVTKIFSSKIFRLHRGKMGFR